VGATTPPTAAAVTAEPPTAEHECGDAEFDTSGAAATSHVVPEVSGSPDGADPLAAAEVADNPDAATARVVS